MSDAPPTETLPIFPLDNVVLFPRVRVPLHIFEPRYRQMTAAALAGDRRIGMVTVRPAGAIDMSGDPEVFAIGCSGLVQQTRRRDDGRYDLVLLGTHRFRILEEVRRPEDRLYRVARVEPLEEHFDEAREAERLQATRVEVVETLIEVLHHAAPQVSRQLDPRRFSGVDDLTFVNALCQTLDLEPNEKQGLLAVDSVVARCEQLSALLRFRLAELSAGIRGHSGTLH